MPIVATTQASAASPFAPRPTGAYLGFEVGGPGGAKVCARENLATPAGPLIYSKVRSSPVVAHWAEARCEASHSFLLNLNSVCSYFLNCSRSKLVIESSRGDAETVPFEY